MIARHSLNASPRVLLARNVFVFRDIYYEDVTLWGSQTLLDETVTQLTRLLRIPRHCINIRATSKGLVAGSLTFLDPSGKLVDCQTPNGTLEYYTFPSTISTNRSNR